MTSETLALAVLALAPTGTALGEVPSRTDLPWRSLSVSIPGSPARSDAMTVHSYRVRVSCTVATATEQGTHRVADEVLTALEGATPVADGWRCGPLLLDGMGTPYMSETTVQSSNTRLCVVHFALTFTAVRLPA